MSVRTSATWAVVAVLVLAPAASSRAYERPGTTELISVRSDGVQPPETGPVVTGGWPLPSSITPDGRYVAFETIAPLVASDVNQATDVYLRDRVKRTTRLVSVGLDGTPGVGAGLVRGEDDHGANSVSFDPQISADGRFVVFSSNAANIVPGDTNQTTDVFVRNIRAARTQLVSVDQKGSFPMPTPGVVIPASYHPSISDNGRYVSFTSDAATIVRGDTNLMPDIFVRDRLRHSTTRVSVTSNGSQASTCPPSALPDGVCSSSAGLGHWWSSSISGNGRFVAFESPLSDLVSGDTNGVFDVFVHDMRTGRTERVSVASDGAQAVDTNPYPAFLERAGSSLTGAVGEQPAQRAISRDGRFVVFVSRAGNLVPNDTDQYGVADNPELQGRDVYVHDRQTGRTTRVSVTSWGAESDPSDGSATISPSISPDGRYVAYFGPSVPSDPTITPDGPYDVQLYDLRTGALDLVSVHVGSNARTGHELNAEGLPDVSAGGRYVSFSSADHDIVPPDRNWHQDLFVRDRGRDLGAGAARVVLAHAASFEASRFATAVDGSREVGAAMTRGGANLTGASLAYRPETDDLFARLDVETMPAFGAANPALQYGLDLRADGTKYQVRVEKVGLTSTFTLYRLQGNSWLKVAELQGGYGTTGDEVVFAIPVADLDLQHGGRLSHVEAFTALGTNQAGPVDVVHRARIR